MTSIERAKRLAAVRVWGNGNLVLLWWKYEKEDV